jgi:hypothetical protein
VIFGAFGGSNGIKVTSRRSPAVLDIFSSPNLQFPTMFGWENGDKDAHSAGGAESQIPMNFEEV